MLTIGKGKKAYNVSLGLIESMKARAPGGKHNRVRRIHDGRPQQHADGIQVIGGARHNVAGSRALVVGIGKTSRCRNKIVAQVEFDFARNADDDPAGQKLENAFDRGHRQQQQRIGKQLVAGSMPRLSDHPRPAAPPAEKESRCRCSEKRKSSPPQ